MFEVGRAGARGQNSSLWKTIHEDRHGSRIWIHGLRLVDNKEFPQHIRQESMSWLHLWSSQGSSGIGGSVLRYHEVSRYRTATRGHLCNSEARPKERYMSIVGVGE